MCLKSYRKEAQDVKSQEENGNITEFNGGAKTTLEVVLKDITKLKKKYTEENGNDI